jgi:protein-disulfide isomerase/Tfp pilus assembly protein PilF
MFVPSKLRIFENIALIVHRSSFSTLRLVSFWEVALRPGRRVLLLFCFLPLCVTPLRAQHASHEAHENVGWIPRDILEHPVSLRHDIGNVHEKVSTASNEAQAFYDQGVNYLSSYVWIEAARSFHQAARLDPGLAAAYLGLSNVYVALLDVPAARSALDKAQSLSAGVTDLERQKIEIQSRLLSFLEDKENLNKFVEYRKALYDALMSNPTDPGLWIQRGFADEGPGAGRGQTGDVDSIAFYQVALALSPDNSAAHHYLAHSFENIGQTEEALKHSEAYLRFSMSIPHAHHMRGHELRRGGRIEDAIVEFRKANDLEEAYYRAENIPPQYDWHRAHNLTLLAMCYQLLGQLKYTEQLLREAFAVPAHSDPGEFARKQWPEYLLSRGRTQEALEQAQLLNESSSGMARFAAHTIMGRALLAMRRKEDAERELKSARDELVLISANDADRLRSYSETLRAEILLSEHNSAEGVGLMKSIEKDLRASLGPDTRSQALIQLESIAFRAREMGEWALAELTAQDMIQLDPSYAGGYYALGLAAENQNNSVLASQQFAVAERLWSEADRDLPELQVLHEKLALKQTGVTETRQQYLKRVHDQPSTGTSLEPVKVDLSFDSSRLRGTPHPQVMIIEFSDFQCPFCRKVQPVLKNLLAKYAGRVSLAYRDFPLRGMHGQAELGAEAARCAGEQSRFWEYHDLLFENPEKINRDGLVALSGTLKLNEKQFESCLSSGKYRPQVERDLQDGLRAGVLGTPAIFVNGVLVSGAEPQATFERIIEAQLAAAKEDRAGR